MKKINGFTVIELVVVIILLSILAANAIPRFTGASLVEPYTYRTQLIAALRLTQQRAMQQTNTSFCHQIVLDNTVARYGIPDRTDCSVIAFPNGWQPDLTGAEVESGQNITFSLINSAGINESNPVTIQFDGLGRPLDNSSNTCQGGCRLQIIGDETIDIIIESEGYIHGS